MPDRELSTGALLDALGFALFVRDSAGALRVAGEPPGWLKRLWPAVADSPVSEASPFLENFLVDAEECWSEGGVRRARSGAWVEHDEQGHEVQLEAIALTIEGQAVLLLERLGDVFEAKKAMLQKARETVIAYQRLNSEIQKKEILLHCVAEEMTAALANVVTSIRLLELEENSPRARTLLGLASRGAEEQQTLINKVLAVFAEELSGLFGQNAETRSEADVSAATRDAIASTAPQCVEKNVRLIPPPEQSGELRVSLDPRHLERLVANLIENALERAPAGSEIAVGLEEEPDSVLLQVQDSGAAVSPDACADLFSKSEPSGGRAQAPALRLHFCRMIAESCGGEIGCATRETGGNRFWIRLPRVGR